MLKVYNGEVYALDVANTSIQELIQTIKVNPKFDKTILLLINEGKTIAACTIKELVENKFVSKTFNLESDFFKDAREYVANNKLGYGSCFPVVDESGECQFILQYCENRVKFGCFVYGLCLDDFLHFDLIEEQDNLDYTLIENKDRIVILEVEEYTYSIAQLIRERFPEKELVLIDEKNEFGWMSSKISGLKKIDSVHGLNKDGKNVLFVQSEMSNSKALIPENLLGLYNSVNVLYSLIWCKNIECLGELNKDKTIFIIDYPTYESGLADIMKYTSWYVMIAKKRGWIPVVDLKNLPNQYQDNAGDNVWTYFFEQVSNISLEEAYSSFRVIRASRNGFYAKEGYDPYVREVISENGIHSFGNILKLNEETVSEITKIQPTAINDSGIRVLGVVARGTDYRREANNQIGRNIKLPDINLFISRVKYMKDFLGCQYVFVATEDSEYFELFKAAFGEDVISVDQKRVFYDYNQVYVPVSSLLEVKDGKGFGRKYLAVIDALSKCDALISNMENGTVVAARSMKQGTYELDEIME